MSLLSGGNISGISIATALNQAAAPIPQLIADKGYDATHLRDLLAAQGMVAVIPSRSSKRHPIP